jgi:alkylhydroperoxidase family enzyme
MSESNCKLRRFRKELRWGMVALALPSLLIGVWGLVTPHGFYDDFPGAGRQWVSALGPYNEHLVRDFAALNLGLGLLLVFGATTLDRRLAQGGLIALAVYSAPHLGYHLFHLDVYSTSDVILNVVALSLNLLVPLLLLALTFESVQSGGGRRRATATETAPGPARVPDKGGALVRFSDWYTRRHYGRAVTTTPVIAHSRPNMLAWGMLEWWHERGHSVDEKLKLLAGTKAATKIGCQFCIDIGSALSRGAGVSEEQLRDFHDYRTSSAFSPVEKLVMEYAEEMSKTNVEISDELFARLREHFDDEQIVELTAAIAIENFRARFNDALDVPPSGFSEGMFCPLPEAARDQENNSGIRLGANPGD